MSVWCQLPVVVYPKTQLCLNENHNRRVRMKLPFFKAVAAAGIASLVAFSSLTHAGSHGGKIDSIHFIISHLQHQFIVNLHDHARIRVALLQPIVD